MIPYAKTFTAAAASTTGFAAAATGASWPLTSTTAADNLAHLVTITNNSATDHSAKTAVITGTDANDLPQTETHALPAASVAITSLKYFKTVTSIVPSATIGADTMGLGWSAVSVTPWVPLDYNQSNFLASWAVHLVSGSLNFDEQHTYDAIGSGASSFTDSTLAGLTASTEATYGSPTRATRVKINSHTSGVFTFYRYQSANA